MSLSYESIERLKTNTDTENEDECEENRYSNVEGIVKANNELDELPRITTTQPLSSAPNQENSVKLKNSLFVNDIEINISGSSNRV